MYRLERTDRPGDQGETDEGGVDLIDSELRSERHQGEGGVAEKDQWLDFGSNSW
jgi:hypothetical protein